MTKDEAYAMALLCATKRLRDAPQFLVRMDAMTEREREIAHVACHLAGSLMFIQRTLDDANQSRPEPEVATPQGKPYPGESLLAEVRVYSPDAALSWSTSRWDDRPDEYKCHVKGYLSTIDKHVELGYGDDEIEALTVALERLRKQFGFLVQNKGDG